MGTESITQPKPHVLILPLDEQGHFTLYLQLLYHLSHYDIRVTYCSTKARCQQLKQLQSKGAFPNLELHLKDIFFSPEASAGPTKDGGLPRLCSQCPEMEAMFKAYMPTLMEEKDPNLKPTFLLADMFLGWTEEIAEKLDIPRYMMFTSAWACYNFLLREGMNATPDDFITLPGLAPFRVKDNIPLMFDSLVNLRNAAGIVCNSLEELEKGVTDAGRSHFQEHPNSDGQVTKFLPILLLPRNPTLPEEKETNIYLEWLDSNAPSSVLYIAFGTQAKLSARTFIELAHGIEASNVPFLWALRLPDGVTELSSVLPPGFLERTKDRGRVETGFIPQWQILNHPSTGGFLSHSGWNSALESVCTGVPVVSLAYQGDGPVNTRLLQEVAKTAVAIPRVNGEAFAGDITTSIRSVMTDAKSAELRENAAKWKGIALASQEDGGCSMQNFRQLLEDIFYSANRK